MSGLVLLVELLDNLQKRIYRTVGASLAACLEPSDQRRNAASLSLFYRYYFGRCSSECYYGVYGNLFFPHTAKYWNFPPIKCFPLTNDLNDFKSGINRQAINCKFSLKRFPGCLLFLFLFPVTPCFVVAVQPCNGVNSNQFI